MLDCVLMHIAQAGQVRFFEGKECVPEGSPDVASRLARGKTPVTRRMRVQLGQELYQLRRRRQRVTDKVIVIGEDRPGFQSPAVLGRQDKQVGLQEGEMVGCLKNVSLLISSSGDHVGAVFAERVAG